MSKIKLLIILSGIIMTIAGFSMTASAISYEYDDLGRLIEVIYDSGQKIVYTYDAGGNILSVKDVTPVKLNPIGNKTVAASETLKFEVTGVGQEGSTLTYTASNLPEGAVFDSATAEFSWMPASNQIGVYKKVRFEVTDGTNTTSEEITIVVTDAGTENRPPYADAGEDRIVKYESENGTQVTLDGSGSFDPDGESGDPSVPGDGKSIISYEWTGDFGTKYGEKVTVDLPIGVHTITLTVSDGILESTDTVNITVLRYGDVDGDGEVNSFDLMLVKRYILKKLSGFPSPVGMIAADVNGDGDVNSTDITLLNRYILRKTNKFPVE